MNQPPRMTIPANIPLIGSGPPPEVRQQQVEQVSTLHSLWPVHPFPADPRAAAHWMGQTMLDSLLLAVLPQFNLKAARGQSLEQLQKECQKAWQCAQMLMETRPIGTRARAEVSLDKGDTKEDGGTEEPSSTSKEVETPVVSLK